MKNNQQQRIKNKVTGAAQWVAEKLNHLVEPAPAIMIRSDRFKARIVTITILVLVIGSSLNFVAGGDLSPLALVLLVAGYFISRTRHFWFSAILVITNISFFVVLALFDNDGLSREVVFMTIAWLTPSLILAGLIFSIRQMLIVSLVHILIPNFLSLLIPEIQFSELLVGTGYLFVVSSFILVSMYLRNLIEKQNQQELARLNEELEDRVLERTAQLEAFSYSVSHDLRAPLRAIRGFSEILEEDHSDPLDDEGRMYLNKIKTSSKNMDHLIDDMLMLSRIGQQELDFQSINLQNMAETNFQELVRTEEEPGAFIFTTKKCPMVIADRNMVNILLTNLISNAIKFSRTRLPAEISFGCFSDQDPVEFYLKDNGIGFDAKLAEMAVRPFQRLHSGEKYEGTGVGLAIVNNIINRHNGHLRVESQPGEGTTFFFSL